MEHHFYVIQHALALALQNKQSNVNTVADLMGISTVQLNALFVRWAGVGFDTFYSLSAKPQLSQLLNSHACLQATSKFNFVVQHHTLTAFKSSPPLTVYYNLANTKMGEVLLASTPLGLCYLAFNTATAFSQLKQRFAGAVFVQQHTQYHYLALQYLNNDTALPPLNLHLVGTNFQLNVWQALLNIPTGRVVSYSQLAQFIGQPKAVRAVGTAVGQNAIAVLLPCHRVVKSDGGLGGYYWGLDIKVALLGCELVQGA